MQADSRCTPTYSVLNKRKWSSSHHPGFRLGVTMSDPITLRDLAALDVSVLKGVGDVGKQSLHDYGVDTVLDLFTERTSTNTIASCPGTKSETRASFVRSTQRRG